MNVDALIRLSAFVCVLGVMASWEIMSPRRRLTTSKLRRWAANLSIVVFNTLVVRMLFASGAMGAALLAAGQGWGLLNRLSLPTWFEGLLAVVMLDFVLYLQHVMFHAVPAFWRFHMMHHADLDVDVTTGARFHPVEVVLSMLIKLGAVVLVGATPEAVLAFEVLLNATAMFNHGNVWMPPATDRLLRWIVVTPDMHRIHHSILPRETNTNFGFNLPWWDRLLGTYRSEPRFRAGEYGVGAGAVQGPGAFGSGRRAGAAFHRDDGSVSVEPREVETCAE